MRLAAGVAMLLLGCTGAVRAAPAAGPAPLRVFAAGSLRAAMTEMLARSGLPAAEVAPPVFGPAGTLGDRIAGGEGADLLASADMAQPRRFATARHPVVLFARNRMCAFSRRSLQLTPANFLDRLLDPKVRVATSTPGADPSGDYAQALFGLAGKARPGADATLAAKAIRLGGAGAKPPRGGNVVADLFLSGKADVLLSYCSGAAALTRDVPDLVAVPAPPALAPRVEFGLVALSGNPLAGRLEAFILSPQGQDILVRNGFIPVAAAGAATAG